MRFEKARLPRDLRRPGSVGAAISQASRLWQAKEGETAYLSQIVFVPAQDGLFIHRRSKQAPCESVFGLYGK